jgi:hypothetical protein
VTKDRPLHKDIAQVAELVSQGKFAGVLRSIGTDSPPY